MKRKRRELLTVNTAAMELEVTSRTIRRYLREGMLRKIRIGRLVRIDREEFENFKGGKND